MGTSGTRAPAYSGLPLYSAFGTRRVCPLQLGLLLFTVCFPGSQFDIDLPDNVINFQLLIFNMSQNAAYLNTTII